MDELRDLDPLELDALREVANIGAGHAATALSQLTERRIMISVPRLHMQPLENLPELMGEAEKVVAAVLMHMLGDLTGRMVFAMPDASARSLCDLLLGRELGTTTSYEALEESGIREAGNILGGAYMNALSEFLHMMLIPSVPSLAVDSAGAILTTAFLNFGRDRDMVFCVETDFHFGDDSGQLQGHFLLLPDTASLRTILDAIRVK